MDGLVKLLPTSATSLKIHDATCGRVSILSSFSSSSLSRQKNTMPVTMTSHRPRQASGPAGRRGSKVEDPKGRRASKVEEEPAQDLPPAEVWVTLQKLMIREQCDLMSAEKGFCQKGTRVEIRKTSEVNTIPPTKRVQIIAAGAPLTGKPLGWVNGTSKDGSETLMLEPPPEESALRH